MITELSLSGIPCFDGGPESLNEIPRMAIFYGPNGAGKSSLARRVAEGAHEVEVAHFSEEYISGLLNTADDLPGIFTIRDAPIDVQKRMDALGRPHDGFIAQAKQSLDDYQDKQTETERLLQDELTAVQERLWQIQKNVVSNNPEFSELFEFAFDSKPGTKKKLFETCQRIYAENPECRPLEQIQDDFGSLSQQQHELLKLLPSLPELPHFASEELELISFKLTSSSESDLKPIFEKLGNTEWVLQGLEFIDHSNRSCPFCRQAMEDSKIDNLEKLLDHSYSKALETLESMLNTSVNAVDNLQRYIAILEEHGFVNSDLIMQVGSLLRRWEDNVDSLRQKVYSPEKVLQLSNHVEAARLTRQKLESVNTEIQKRIDLARNRVDTESRLRDEIWNVFVMEQAKPALIQYIAATKKPKIDLQETQQNSRDMSLKLDGLQREYTDLFSQVSDSAVTVERINRMLEALGFYSFRVQPQGERDTYSLVRADGSSAASTLSEGEKTFIAFLYFYESTVQKAQAIENDKDLIVVIDDPVSSLDSDTLFLISILTRNLIDMCDYKKNPNGQNNEKTRLKQLFLLTHNAYFHKEVTNRINAGKKWDLKYFTLRKGVNGPTEIASFNANPIESLYSGLWREIREGAENGGEVTPAIQNSMRRIIENYFRSQGGLNLDYLRSELSSAEYSVSRSLVSWLHDGSHNIPWDPDFAPTQYDNTIYYEAFRKIFEYSKQGDHYKFMMDVPSGEES